MFVIGQREGETPRMQQHAKKVAIGIVGGLVVAVGVAMIVLPGPAFIVIPAGLAILASEFEWAQRWLHKARDFIHQKREEHRERKQAKARTPAATSK